MPPVGNFAVPASTSKDNKKRSRVNAAAPPASQANLMGDSSRGVGPASSANKVNITVCSPTGSPKAFCHPTHMLIYAPF